jgi:DNA-binding transcriptional ArsR family regulator
MVNDSTRNLDDVFSALSDPTRRAILERLFNGELTVTALAEPFEMSLPAISKHLRVLEKAGVVSQRKLGRNRYYSVNPHAMKQASEWINRWSHFWKSQFSNLDRYLAGDPNQD